MRTKRAAAALLVSGFISTCPPIASQAIAATAQASDLTDFIQRLGGYVSPIQDTSVPTQTFWEQVSYKVTPASTSSNITTITMSKYTRAAVFNVTGAGTITPATVTTTLPNPTSLNFCSADNYVVETVTLDLRDLQAATTKSPGADGQTQTWSITLQTNGGKFIRQNTQTLPANCAPGTGYTPAPAINQQDVSHYAIVFADPGQANQFQKLVSNVIPTLNPPVLIGATSGP